MILGHRSWRTKGPLLLELHKPVDTFKGNFTIGFLLAEVRYPHCWVLLNCAILGDGDFVMDILSEANERIDRRYELKSLGYDLDKIEQRVLEIYQLEKQEFYSKSRMKIRSEARSVFCYWAVRELGVEGARLARRFNMSQAGVGYAVKKGEKIVKEKAIPMIE